MDPKPFIADIEPIYLRLVHPMAVDYPLGVSSANKGVWEIKGISEVKASGMKMPSLKLSTLEWFLKFRFASNLSQIFLVWNRVSLIGLHVSFPNIRE